MARHICREQMVEVIAGAHKGSRGKVLRIDEGRGMVVVEGVNMVYRHVRPTRRNPQGGRLKKEAPIHISNVLPYDPKVGKGTRVHFELERDEGGKVVSKQRVSKEGNVLGTLRKTEQG
jgi:large subunit ribosomal protein L24